MTKFDITTRDSIALSILAMNNIPFITSIDENKLTQEYIDGKDIVACYWSAGDKAKFEDFYQLTLSHDH